MSRLKLNDVTLINSGGMFYPVQTNHVDRFALSKDVLTLMLGDIARYPHVETGGILIGRILGRRVWITQATTGGPNAIRRPHEFVRDPEFCQARLQEAYAATEGAETYIGEWHRHCTRGTNLSEPDLLAMAQIATTPTYQTPNPIFLVVGMPDTGDAPNRKIAVTAWNGGQVQELEGDIQ